MSYVLLENQGFISYVGY